MTDSTSSVARPRVISAHLRVGVSVLVGLVAGIAAGELDSWKLALLAGWDAAAVFYVTWVGLTVFRLGAQETAALASVQDPSRIDANALLLAASVASLVAVVFALFQAGDAKGMQKDLLIALGGLSVIVSWVLVHILFALRYARLYFDPPVGGIDFNGEEEGEGAPTYMDFAYVAFTVGMTFQVSDTDIKTSGIRAAVLHHSLISYLFGAVILAASVNLLAGLAK